MAHPPDTAIAADLAAIARIEAVPTILKTIAESTGLRFTLVARVLPSRWVACAVHDEIAFGLKAGGELDVATTLCAVVRDSHRPVLIDEVATDPVYCDHPTPKMYGFQSYVAVPIFRRNGEYFGNLCGLDPLPNKLSDGKTLATLKLFSELVSMQLEAEERHEDDRAALDDERETAKLREELIAVLGHDLRTPLSSIALGTHILLDVERTPAETRVLERIRASTRRMAALVEDTLDLARLRLGDGLELQLSTVDDLEKRVAHVVDEARAASPERIIELRLGLTGPVSCDVARIEQVVQNLVTNAVQHGEAGAPVSVELFGSEQTFEIRVGNAGTIDEATQASLFRPYFRARASGRGEGLGLGLYIVSEIARAHRGTVKVTSRDGRTEIVFCVPRASAAG